MSMRIQLVFVPGRRARLHSLCPKTTPLMITGMLRGDGIAADFSDFGVLDALDTGAVQPDVGHADTMGAGWMRFWGRSGGIFASASNDSAIGQENYGAWLSQTGQHLLTTSPSLIAWYVEDRDGYIASKAVSGYIRKCAPHIHQTILGPYMTRFGASAMTEFLFVDTAILGEETETLSALAENLGNVQAWRHIPGLLFRDGATLVHNPTPQPPMHTPRFGDTTYLPDHAGAVTPRGQFAIYPLSFIAHGADSKHLALDSPPQWPQTETSVFNAICALNRRYGAGAFQIEASHASRAALECFAEALLSQNVMAVYSLGGLTEPFDAALADRLFASGCRAVGFHAPTGSQRLLEDFHGRDMSISAIRATLRCCRAAGLFTAVHLCYPCPRDDYHTRAETELFIEACRPDGLHIEAPVLHPESLWFKRAPAYGFQLDYRAYQKWVGGQNVSPYRMQGWKNGRPKEARQSLMEAALQSGCIPGVTELYGLLARIARSAMDEPVFLEQLKHALAINDTKQMRFLMAQINGTLDILQSPDASMRHAAEAL